MTLRKFNGFGFFLCFYYATNFLVQNECMFLEFFSFNFKKIKRNYPLFLILLNSADLRGDNQRLYFTKKKHTPEDEHDGNGEI